MIEFLKSSIVSYTSSCLPVTYVYINFLITDELIRQVTINCAERGLLLLRSVFALCGNTWVASCEKGPDDMTRDFK